MARISLERIFRRQRKIRFLTILALFLISVVFGQLMLSGGSHWAKAAGESEENPYIIDESGYIYYGSDGHSYFVRQPVDCDVTYYNGGISVWGGGSNYDTTCYQDYTKGDSHYISGATLSNNDLTNRHVRITGSDTVIAMWGGPHQFASFVLMGNAIVTHAPLVYFVNDGDGNDYRQNDPGNDAYLSTIDNPNRYVPFFTPGYFMQDKGEKDFDINTGALQGPGLLKKVSIEAGKIVIIDGQINVMGRGYPGASGYSVASDDVAYTDYYRVAAGHAFDSNADLIAAKPVGLPLSYGGGGGYALAGGCTTSAELGGGGSGFVATGGRGLTEESSTECAKEVAGVNSSYGNIATPASGLLHGPGGGGSGRYMARVYRGGSGGGAVLLTGSAIELHSSSVLNASGQNGLDDTGSNANKGGGGGAGGTITLEGTVTYLDDQTNQVNGVIGGSYGGSDGTYLQNNGSGVFTEVGALNLSALVIAKGGQGEIGNFTGACIPTSESPDCAGGGGGGAIILDGTTAQSCTITADDGGIPAACETQDVVVDGKYYTVAGPLTIDVSAIPVWQSDLTRWETRSSRIDPGTGANIRNKSCSNNVLGVCIFWNYEMLMEYHAGDECSDTATQSCDTKRHFRSLVIRNNVIVTHAAVASGDMAEDLNQSNGLAGSLADETAGLARWKKVDFEVNGELRVETGGKIDVSGKGYPGGSFTGNCGFNGDYTPIAGGGPGLGFGTMPSNKEQNKRNGGGGGFGGDGGLNPVGWGVHYPDSSDIAVLKNLFDFGSGGGAGYESHHHGLPRNQHDWACYSGGNGGGRIRVFADTVSVSNGYMVADGAKTWMYTYGGDDSVDTRGGGGSGGTILLVSNNYSFQGASIWSYIGANINGRLGYGYADTGGPVPYNISSNGGSGHNDSGGGGGGEIIIKKPDIPVFPIKKVLHPIERNNLPNTTFNPYSLMQGDVVRVDLSVIGLDQPIILTDELLNNHQGHRCEYVDDAAKPSLVNGNAVIPDETDPMIWNGVAVAPGTNEATVSYYCRVD